MKIKIKGTNKEKTVTPNEWSVIEKNGNASNFEIVERNTVWLAPIDSVGEMVVSHKREFELEHWHRLLELGSKNKWIEVKSINNKTEISEDIIDIQPIIKPITEDKSLEISELQIELTQAQIEKTNAETTLTIEKTKDLNRKILYFIVGVIVGNIDTILKLLRLIDPS
jgi:hypothetical protein